MCSQCYSYDRTFLQSDQTFHKTFKDRVQMFAYNNIKAADKNKAVSLTYFYFTRRRDFH